MSSGRPAPGCQSGLSPGHRDCLLLIICTLTFAVYQAVIRHSFLAYDDPFFVTENPYVRQGLTAEGMAWAATATLGFYHPITWLSLMLDATLFGVQPAAFHLTNLWLHIANIVLVFHFLHRATGDAGRSLVVAGLFAWHPINVETVAWISERKGLLATLFALLALIAYVRHAGRPSRSRMAGVALAMLLSLLCKGTAVILPALCLVLDYWPLQRLAGRESGEPMQAVRPNWRLVVPLIVEKAPSSCCRWCSFF